MEPNFDNLLPHTQLELVNKNRIVNLKEKERSSSLTKAEQVELKIREETGDAEFAFLASEKAGGRKLSEEEEDRLAEKIKKYKM